MDDIPAPSEVVETVTAPVADAVETVGDAAQEAIRELAAAVRINTEVASGNRDALGRIEANITEIVNRFSQTVEAAADAAVETVEDAAEVVADAPVAGAEVVEAVVEDAGSPPKRKPRGVLGRTRRGRRRG